MPEMDPYAVLGVPRTADRAEIAKAYRRLAKRHHPDVGVKPSPTMARINEAWFVLSDATRRARWDRTHARQPVLPPEWAAPVVRPVAPRPAAAAAPPTVRDSPWLAVGVVVGAVLLIGVVMAGITMGLAGPQASGAPVDASDFSFVLADDWEWIAGDATDPDERRVIGHLVTFPVTDDERCRSFDDPCPLNMASLPPGQASVVITGWGGRTPPIADPTAMDPARLVGGAPAALDLRRVSGGALAWWQLSPPDFPERWIEVRADIRGGAREQDERIAEIEAMLDSLEFLDPGDAGDA